MYLGKVGKAEGRGVGCCSQQFRGRVVGESAMKRERERETERGREREEEERERGGGERERERKRGGSTAQCQPRVAKCRRTCNFDQCGCLDIIAREIFATFFRIVFVIQFTKPGRYYRALPNTN
jgi:hypothetical protein